MPDRSSEADPHWLCCPDNTSSWAKERLGGPCRDDVALARVAVEGLLGRRCGVVGSAGGLERLGECHQRVTVQVQGVGVRRQRNGLTGDPSGFVELPKPRE